MDIQERTFLQTKMSMAKDCLQRTCDGIDSGNLRYSLEQIGKCSLHLSDASFELDRLELVEEKIDEHT
jgi:hypothetical protein